MSRAGVQPGDRVLELAKRVHAAPGLELCGIMGYEGHLLLIPDLKEKEAKISEAMACLVSQKVALEVAGLPCPIVSAGGSGSYPFTAQQPGLTEIQAGGAVFMDLLYRNQCHVRDFDFALTIDATVTSRPAVDRAIIDAGRKTMSQDFNMPEFVGRDGDLELQFLSAEHGTCAVKDGCPGPEVGERVSLLPGYCDFTTVLHDRYYACRGDV
eukprot:CAMPEP_0206288328 /NCGR_PEP_ID=MMETSP0106_2-20121207/1559_1 /ASSEMBLY_ACC=CAM_ASM_000206 /TAXON_ID=81532 /ORGANISM="Acanthoeca-like sp., Strain 10tr" /LENGTH=210 /DNA_ID=CAMNT_0053718877 /DNA_START=1 /DNA_END=630 /DNA_ORIENTATION=+